MWWSCNTFSSLGKGIHLVTRGICDIVGWNTFEMDWWSVILIFSSSYVSGRVIKYWSLLSLSFHGPRVNLLAWVLSGNIGYCIPEHSILWGNYRSVSDSLSWKQSGCRDVWCFCDADSSPGKGIHLVTIRISDIVGWNPTELSGWSVILNFSSGDVSGWAIECWSIQHLGFVGKWFNPCARGPNGDVRSKMSRLDWRGTLVDFSSLEIIQRTLCWSIQTFCLPREWVDPLTEGNVYLVEFISSLGWWNIFLYFSSEKTAIGGEWWLTFQFRTVFSEKKEVQEQVFFGSFFRLAKRNMNLDHPIFFPMYSVATRDSSLLLGVEYCWRILPKVSFYFLIMRSVSSFLSLMKRVLGQVPTAVRYLDNSNCLLIFGCTS